MLILTEAALLYISYSNMQRFFSHQAPFLPCFGVACYLDDSHSHMIYFIFYFFRDSPAM